MPVSTWDEVAGLQCKVGDCRNPATHIYGGRYICCQCHDPDGGGLISPEEARRAHEEVARRRAKS